jgi:hypothetical protein
VLAGVDGDGSRAALQGSVELLLKGALAPLMLPPMAGLTAGAMVGRIVD